MKTLSFKLTKIAIFTSLLSLSSTPLLLNAGEERRAPPETRSAGTLSDTVIRSITRISEYLSPEDGGEPDLASAKEELDELYERRYERMNNFEKSTILNFYTNYYMTTENYPETIRIFEQILTLDELRADVRDRALKSLGQLTQIEERWQDSIRYLNMWREQSEFEEDGVFKSLASAHFQIEEFSESLVHWLNHMNFQADAGEPLVEQDYRFLQGLYFTLEDYPNALEVTKTIIMLYDQPQDWRNLSAIYATLDNDENRIRSLNIAYLKGYIDDENNFLSLGQSLAATDQPYSGTKILQAGAEAGYVQEDEDNLNSLVQMYMLANQFELALEPAQRLADIMDGGDGYDILGYIQYVLRNYEEAVTALETALDRGELSDAGSTNLYLAYAFLELDRFDEADAAARRAADMGSSGTQRAATTYLNAIAGTRARHNTIQTRKQEAIDFYRPYPPLL